MTAADSAASCAPSAAPSTACAASCEVSEALEARLDLVDISISLLVPPPLASVARGDWGTHTALSKSRGRDC